MTINELFQKKIDRDLKVVIKVEQNDEKTVYQELDEYVVTNELRKHFRRFFENYRTYTNESSDKIGVWITGFFGSGKSHFLKILAYILENRTVCGKSAASFFTEDESKLSDSMIVADIKAALQNQPEVILFDIDAKSRRFKDKKESIVDILVRVFNEHRGYCSTALFIAELEERLDEKGFYDKFKEAFFELSKKSWEEERNKHAFVQKHLKNALTKIGYMDAEEAKLWYAHSKDSLISIEEFAQRLKKYCDGSDSGGKPRRIVFLIDEVGQYIGDDPNLMLNLQTMVHNLGTHCRGKVWIIVTSQQDIDSITKVKGGDFSKITGRFDTRLSLTSSNVDEVIRRRLLSKTDEAQSKLKDYYDEKSSIIKNLINFNNSANMKLYSGSENFADVYPFVPYQFNLLGRVLNAIREHGASGKHLSEGERSMLNLVRKAAISVMNDDIGTLVSFNRFYDAGISDYIDDSQSSVIIRAAENENLEDYDVEVLKILFMLKYVKEIRANIENLTTLLVSSVDDDRTVIQTNIAASLKRLERETLIQKNGSIYEFLTADEQNINRAISRVTVEDGEITQDILEFIFDDILSNISKATGPNKKYVYDFNRCVDDKYHKKIEKYPLSLVIYTPAQGLDADDVRYLSSMNKGLGNDQKKGAYVLLKDDGAYRQEIVKSIQIKKYLHGNGAGNPDLKERKNREVNECRDRARKSLKDSLNNADIYVNGEICDVGGSDSPEERIRHCLSKLVEDAYHKLSLIGDMNPSESDIRSVLEGTKQTNLDGRCSYDAAVNEIVGCIRDRQRGSYQTTLKSLQDHFFGIPYGFRKENVSWLVASAFADNRITLKYHSKNLSLNLDTIPKIMDCLTKNDEAERLVIEIKENISQEYIRGAKDVLKGVFNITPESDREDYLMDTFNQESSKYVNKLNHILDLCKKDPRLPGVSEINAAKKLFSDASLCDLQSEFFKYLNEHKDDLLDAEDDMRQVRGFYEGMQYEYFMKALGVLDSVNLNSTYLSDKPEFKRITDSISEIVGSENPYLSVNELKDRTDEYYQLFNAELGDKRKDSLKYVDDAESECSSYAAEKGVSAEFAEIIVRDFAGLREKINSSEDFGSIINAGSTESSLIANKIHEKIDSHLREKESAGNVDEGNGAVSKSSPKTKHVALRDLQSGLKTRLESEDDVDDYLAGLKKKIMKNLEDDTILIIR